MPSTIGFQSPTPANASTLIVGQPYPFRIGVTADAAEAIFDDVQPFVTAGAATNDPDDNQIIGDSGAAEGLPAQDWIVTPTLHGTLTVTVATGGSVFLIGAGALGSRTFTVLKGGKMYIPLIDAALVLQAAVTKTASFNSAWLDLGEKYNPDSLGSPIGGVVNVTAIDRTTGDETYAFKLQQADPDVNGVADDATAADIGASVSTTVVGIVVAKGLQTKRFVRLAATLAGTTPSVTYSANVGK